MRKIVVSEFISLDGVIEDPGGTEKSEYGGWTIPYWNDDIGIYKKEELFSIEALLLGRVTYQGFAEAWTGLNDKEGFAERMNNLPKFVASRTLPEVAWNHSKLITGDVPAEIAKLKQQTGLDILVGGSSLLVQTLRDHQLVDEYRLLVYPVIVGGGKRLFQDGERQKLKLIGTKSFTTGVMGLTYQLLE